MRGNEVRDFVVPAKILPNLASQIRTAFSSMAWNTDSRSPGELLMTEVLQTSPSAALTLP